MDAARYRCPFVELVQSVRRDPYSKGVASYSPVVIAAAQILDPKESAELAKSLVGDPVRGEVHRRVRTQRPSPYEYKPEVRRANHASGEFTAKPAPHYIEGAEFKERG